MERLESKLERALASLRSQRITVSQPIVGEQGFVFDVMGFMLTAAQINDLFDLRKLDRRGIREFAESVKDNSSARRILPSRVLSTN